MLFSRLALQHKIKSGAKNNSIKSSRKERRRSGSIVVVVAMSLVMLMGCAAISVDYGVLVTDANNLQRACDAAATAGANELYKYADVTEDQRQARYMAMSIAYKNGVVLQESDVAFSPPTAPPLVTAVTSLLTQPPLPPRSNRITVKATRVRSLFFARALGFANGTVTRSATAGRVALRGINQAVPLAMTINDYYNNISGGKFDYQLIRNQDTDFIPGTVASLDLRPDNSGKSGSIFEEDLKYGYGGTVVLNQKISNALTSDVGSQGAKLENAMLDRIARAAGAPWRDTGSNYVYPNYPPGDPRVMMLIVAPPNAASNNNPTLDAKFFVPVYLDQVKTPGNKRTILTLRILPTQTYGSQDPNVILDGSDTTITGPSVVSLFN